MGEFHWLTPQPNASNLKKKTLFESKSMIIIIIICVYDLHANLSNAST